jgi:uncharacterized membrane protein
MIDPINGLVIALMALATYLCRSLGYLAMAYVPLTGRVRRGLEALPGAVVVSIVLPGALAAGPAGLLGIVASVVAMLLLRRDFLALAAGCGTAALLRAAGF